jgi:very-short-patch-repair endonuclease
MARIKAICRGLVLAPRGVAFRRQVPIDRYIADFLAPAVGLVVEVDGAGHSLRRSADARRDRVLQRLGYRVLRVDAELVRGNLAKAVALIAAALRVGCDQRV